jgi:hypothetical protein
VEGRSAQDDSEERGTVMKLRRKDQPDRLYDGKLLHGIISSTGCTPVLHVKEFVEVARGKAQRAVGEITLPSPIWQGDEGDWILVSADDEEKRQLREAGYEFAG